MKRYCVLTLTILMLTFLILGGCSSSIDEETFNELKTRVDNLDASTSQLAAIAAYDIWYAQYYALGTYAFETTGDFNIKLSSLITSTGDANVIAVWNTYLVEDQAYTALIVELPQDTTTWTSDQYNKWLKSGTKRAETLGQVGGQLFTAVQKQ